MSISVSRESISKLMTELVDSFPMEGEGRASISDFGKLLFAEGQTSTTAASSSSAPTAAASTPSDARKDADSTGSGSDQDSSSSAPSSTQTGSKRVFTEIKGVPRQKQHDIMKSKDKAVPKRWTQEEDDRLRDAVSRHGERNWKSIAEEVPGRNHTQCLQRWTKVLAPGLVKGHWRPDEDELLKELVAEGRKNWGQVATRIPGRTSKQCRERWYNHLDPSIVRGEYTAEEDRIILDAQSRLGNRWSAIAAMLPGRTEDAVKIRWKSLCRVRKGQGRRAQADKGKKDMDALGGVGVVNAGGDAGNGMQMLHHPLAANNSGFAGNLVKSEEVGSFSPMPTHPPQMVRLASGQLVPAAAAYGGPAGAPGMPPSMTPQSSAATPMMTMMYIPQGQPDMGGGGYDPTMAHYRKPPMAPPHVVNSYGHMSMGGGVVNAGSMPPNAGSATLASPSGMGMPSPSNGGGYAQPYAMAVPNGSYATDMNMYGGGNVNTNGGAVYGVVASPQMAMYRTSAGIMMSPQASPQHQQQQSPHQSQMMGNNGNAYGYGLPATPTNGGGMMQQNSGFNPAAAFAQQQQQQQQQRGHYMQQQSGMMPSSTTVQEQEQPNPEAPPSPPVAEQKTNEAGAPPTAATSCPMANPAAMFAQRQAANMTAPAPSAVQPMMAGNPVAAFLKQQQQQKRKEQPASSTSSSSARPAAVSSSSYSTSSSGPIKPFNPALAFAQRMQVSSSTQKPPPMPLSNKSSEGDTADEEEGDSGDARGREPSLKKVKPRLSIDAARASAARRLRNSGSGGALTGRPSLDGFLNEIGDVGRLSDLKMEEFQTLDELWRVSGDMDRLSL